MSNPYCEPLGIRTPVLEELIDHPRANAFSMLIAALLERGQPMTLVEAALRLEQAGFAPAEWALSSLQSCRPARPPIYRDGDRYALDPHSEELDRWAFRLDLRPAKRKSPAAGPALKPDPLPGPEVPMTTGELEQAWREAYLYSNWSAQRVALAVLDAHGRPMAPAEVLSFLEALGTRHLLSASSARYWHRGSALRVGEDGRWEIAPGDQAQQALRSARAAVRTLVERIRLREARRPDPEEVRARFQEWEQQREAHGAELARLSRVLIHGFPAGAPKALVLLDVGARQLSTFLGPELDLARRELDRFEVIAGVEVRALLRALDIEPGARRLAELGPPQKSRRLNRRGRTLKITTELLIRGSCGISSPLGDERKLKEYLRNGQITKLRRRLEADAKALYAYYQYGRLHGAVRLRWGFLNKMISAPWVQRDEPVLGDLKKRAYEQDRPLEVVTGSAPGWAEPWSRARSCWVEKDERGWSYLILDEDGFPIDEREVQAARIG